MSLNIFDKHTNNLTIREKSQIKDAIKIIQLNSERICFVINKKGKLVYFFV